MQTGRSLLYRASVMPLRHPPKRWLKDLAMSEEGSAPYPRFATVATGVGATTGKRPHAADVTRVGRDWPYTLPGGHLAGSAAIRPHQPGCGTASRPQPTRRKGRKRLNCGRLTPRHTLEEPAIPQEMRLVL